MRDVIVSDDQFHGKRNIFPPAAAYTNQPSPYTDHAAPHRGHGGGQHHNVYNPRPGHHNLVVRDSNQQLTDINDDKPEPEYQDYYGESENNLNKIQLSSVSR